MEIQGAKSEVLGARSEALGAKMEAPGIMLVAATAKLKALSLLWAKSLGSRVNLCPEALNFASRSCKRLWKQI